MSMPDFDFSLAQRNVLDGLVLTPLLHAYLYDAKFPPTFTVEFRRHLEPRKPDGYFHPSTHPLMSERQLFWYLTEPDRVEVEPFEFKGALSVTMGTAVHDFIEMCMYDLSILVKPTGTCVCCGREHGFKKGQCREPGANDDRLMSRGHMDGILDIPGWGQAGFEFKTSNQRKLANVTNLDAAKFREKWPEYYGQVQNYMHITGLRRFIVFFLGMGFPWETREFVIEYDAVYCYGLEMKYLRALEAARSGRAPDACCAPRSKESKVCLARSVCPVALL